MKYVRFYIKPTAPFHLQTGGLDDHEQTAALPKSDMFSSAIMAWLFRQYPDEATQGTMPFVVSSLYPAIDAGEHRVGLYPIPVPLKSRLIESAPNRAKEFKKLQFVDETVLECWCKDPESIDDEKLDIRQPVAMNNNGIDIDDQLPLWEIGTRTRVVLDRSSRASTPFHFASVKYGPNTLLFGHVAIEQEQKSMFEALIRLLGDEGLGADRTVGHGQFDYLGMETVPGWMTREDHTGSDWYTLGMYNPPDEERRIIEWHQSWYELTRRYGWVGATGLRRASLPMIQAGAVLKSKNRPQGRMTTVLDPSQSSWLQERLDHPVYRDGRILTIPCKTISGS